VQIQKIENQNLLSLSLISERSDSSSPCGRFTSSAIRVFIIRDQGAGSNPRSFINLIRDDFQVLLKRQHWNCRVCCQLLGKDLEMFDFSWVVEKTALDNTAAILVPRKNTRRVPHGLIKYKSDQNVRSAVSPAGSLIATARETMTGGVPGTPPCFHFFHWPYHLHQAAEKH
jgi:hypothetical protein